MFQIFDRDNSGTVSLQEFLDAMHQFAGQSHDDKIRFLFKVYDLDGRWQECRPISTVGGRNVGPQGDAVLTGYGLSTVMVDERRVTV